MDKKDDFLDVMSEVDLTHITNYAVEPVLRGFGDQTNINFTTNSSTYVTGYTIESSLFEAGKTYMLFVSWTQRSTDSDKDVGVRLTFNGSVIPRSEFINSSPVSIRSNGFYLGKITQDTIVSPILIEVAYLGGIGNTQEAVLDHIRWFAIDIDSLSPTDYYYGENNTSTSVATGGTYIVNLPITTNNEDWMVFYCLNARDNVGSLSLIDPTSNSGFGVLASYNFNNSFITAGSSHKFENVYDNKSQSFMQFVDAATASSGEKRIYLEADKNNAISGSLHCTGSVFAIKNDVLNGVYQNAGAPTSLITRSIPEPVLVWNVGWNSNDSGIISNNIQISDSGIEEKIPTNAPMNMDWRVDVLGPGSFDFEYNGVNNDDKRHAVFFLLASPISYKQHSTDVRLELLESLRHSTDAFLSKDFSVHTVDVLLTKVKNIAGSGNITIGKVKGEGSGVISRLSDSIDPTCINRRILGKYGWTPTKTRTTGFKSCKIKR